MGLNKKRWDVFISGKGWDDIEYAAVKKAVEKERAQAVAPLCNELFTDDGEVQGE